MSAAPRKLAVFKFASCDGCQLQLLALDELLFQLVERFHLASFLEVTSRVEEGPFDVVLVEGSITTPGDAERIRHIREQAGTLISIGACATAGGIQALRNAADVEEWKAHVYPHPEWLETLATSTPIAAHVKVDAELHGCPINPEQALRVLSRALLGAQPDLPNGSVCGECKRRGQVCVMVTRGIPCLGPATRAGCGALCPSLGRDCYGCFGPTTDPNPEALAERFEQLGLDPAACARRFRGITGASPAFRRVAEALEPGDG